MKLMEILRMLPSRFRRQGFWVALGLLLQALLNVAGLAALIPLLMLALDPGFISHNAFFSHIRNWFPDQEEFTYVVCGSVIAFIVLKNLIGIGLSYMQTRYSTTLHRFFSTRLYQNYYDRGLLFIKSTSSTSISHKINAVCSAFVGGVIGAILIMAGDIIMVLTIGTLLLLYNALAVLLLAACFVPVILAYVCLIRHRLERYGKEENEARRQLWRVTVETFLGYPDVESNLAFPLMQERFSKGLDHIIYYRIRMSIIGRIPSGLMEICIAAGMVLLVLLTRGTGNHSFQLLFGIFALAAVKLLPAVKGILGGFASLRRNQYTLEVIQDALEQPKNRHNTTPPLSFKQSIEVKHLGFQFPDMPDTAPPVLHDLSFSIRKGERLGIRGISGSGKTTLLNLLLGFYPVQQGRILIDGIPLTEENRLSWLKRIGYVSQHVFLIEGTLAENIAFGNTDERIDREKITRILEQVQLKKFVDQQLYGMDTVVGEHGCRLSGGQRQRVGIARALYKDADILFFDEATSSLDVDTEIEVNRAIRSLSQQHKELTIVLIAHRNETLSLCERILTITE